MPTGGVGSVRTEAVSPSVPVSPSKSTPNRAARTGTTIIKRRITDGAGVGVDPSTAQGGGGGKVLFGAGGGRALEPPRPSPIQNMAECLELYFPELAGQLLDPNALAVHSDRCDPRVRAVAAMVDLLRYVPIPPRYDGWCVACVARELIVVFIVGVRRS